MNKTLVLTSALVLSGLSASAVAADNSWFVRGEVGRSHAKAGLSGFGNSSDNDTAYSVRSGYWFTPNVAIEGFYSRLYDKNFTYNSPSDGNFKLSAIGVGVVGKKNFGPDNTGFFVDGRAGVSRSKASASLAGFGSDSQTSTKPYYGVGAGYDFSHSFGLSLNYDHLRGDGNGISLTTNTLAVGGEVRF